MSTFRDSVQLPCTAGENYRGDRGGIAVCNAMNAAANFDAIPYREREVIRSDCFSNVAYDGYDTTTYFFPLNKISRYVCKEMEASVRCVMNCHARPSRMLTTLL
jgi:hypothetical protein